MSQKIDMLGTNSLEIIFFQIKNSIQYLSYKVMLTSITRLGRWQWFRNLHYGVSRSMI